MADLMVALKEHHRTTNIAGEALARAYARGADSQVIIEQIESIEWGRVS